MAALLVVATQIRLSADLAEDRRNSFPAADQRELAKLNERLVVTVHLAPEDPRYADLRRNVLAKLERVMPRVNIRLAGGGQTIVGSSTEQSYGEIEYSYAGRSAKSRSTSHREALPVLYELAGRPPPTPIAGEDYPGYPLVAEAQIFFAANSISDACVHDSEGSRLAELMAGNNTVFWPPRALHLRAPDARIRSPTVSKPCGHCFSPAH